MVNTITIPKDRLAELNAYLNSGPHNDGDGVIEQWTVEFPDGHSADIKVCAGGSECQPYIDPVLFDEAGNEREVLDAGRGVLQGRYEFQSGYVVVIEEG
jgi:hypothetical protein